MHTSLPFIKSQNMLILTPADSQFHQRLQWAAQLYRANPAIEVSIIADQNHMAQQKKALRIEDRRWEEGQNPMLPNIDLKHADKIDAKDLKLAVGRPRMAPFVVYIYLCIRGQWGGIKSQEAKTLQDESTTLMLFLQQYGLKRPGSSTILDNLNVLSEKTLEVIFKTQTSYIIGEGLDDFNELTIDSTAVKGNTSWPTESSILMRLTKRIYHIGSHLDYFGIENIQERNFPKLIQEMKTLNTTIAFECGKKDSESKRKVHYKALLKKATSAKGKFDKELIKLDANVAQLNILPSKQKQLSQLIDIMKEDTRNLQKVIEYCSLRVMENKKTPSAEKVVSMSDKNVSCIVKGGRVPVFGYKPQLGRSKQGFISCLITPEGNASDSGQLDAVIKKHVSNTQVVPSNVSTDDGYANTAIRDEWLGNNVTVFSTSGSKGKRLTPEKEWDSEIYCETRNNRSAVESLMFCLKYGFHFGQVMRRGIENVRKELLEKVLAYNFDRIRVIQRRLQLSS